jgi:uncharacterized protein YegP (UPF0339 family)
MILNNHLNLHKLIPVLILVFLISCTPQNKKEAGDENAITISSPQSNPYSSAEELIVIKGNCKAGGTVNLSGSSNASMQCLSGTFSFPIKQTEAGEYTFSVSQTIKNGVNVTASAGTILTWIKTNTTLSLPIITSPSTNPYHSNSGSLSLSGTCESGNKIHLTGSSSSSIDCVNGVFNFNLPSATDGQFNYSLVQAATSSQSMSGVVSFQWVKDTVAPSAPVITTPSSTNYTSNVSGLNISGTCENLTLVSISGSLTNSQQCTSGVFNFTDTQNLDSTYNYSIVQTDKAGNISPAVTLQWIKSSVPPAPPVITLPANSNITNNLSSLIISGTCDSGNTIEISGSHTGNTTCSGNTFSFNLTNSTDGVYTYSLLQKNTSGLSSSNVSQTWTRDTLTPSALVLTTPAVTPYNSSSSNLNIIGTCESGTTVYVSGAEILSGPCSAGSFNITLNQVSDGNYSYSILQSDLAGNNSLSTNLNWIKDSTPPSAPTVTSFVSPLTNNLSTLTISGACESNSTVNLSGSSTATTTCSANTYSFNVNKSSDGSYSFNVTQTDLANNTSPQTSVSWNRDTIAPASLVISNPNTTPYGSSNASITISGSCENGATVYLSGDDSNNTLCSTNSFSFVISKTLDLTYVFNLHQADIAGNLSATTTQTWVKDSSSPAAPTLTIPGSNPYFSNTSTLTISGSCTSGFSIEISGDLNASTTCTAGSFSFIDTKTIDDSYNYSLIQKNLSGISSAAVTLDWTRDTINPINPLITLPNISPFYSNSNNFSISGTCETGASVHIGGDFSGSTICATTSYSFNITKTVDASYTFTISQTDPAGNNSGSATTTWQRDSVSPSPVSLTAPTSNPYFSGDTNITLAGACEAGSTVSLSGDASGATTCSASSLFSFSINKTTDGIYNFSITQTDISGNISSPLAFEWTRDTAVPTTPTITTPIVNPFSSNSNSLSISVNCDDTLTPTAAIVNILGDISAAEVTSPAGELSQACDTSPVVFVVQKSSDGSYNFQFNQENPTAGTTSATVGLNWIKDTVAPTAPTITSPSSSPLTAPGTLTLMGTCNAGNTVTITGDLSQSVTCDIDNSFNFVDSKTVDATYNYAIKQIDLAGNISSSVAFQWVRNSSSIEAPTIVFPSTSPYTSNSSSLTISGTCTDTYLIEISGDLLSSEISTPANSLSQLCIGGTFSYVIDKTTDGTFNFSLTQSQNGVSSAVTSLSWSKDTVAPIVSITATPSDPNLTQALSFSFNADDVSATFECKLDSESYATCASPKSIASIANGSHTFYVRAIDSAANVSSTSSYTWTQTAYNTLALYHLDSSSPTTDSGNFTQISGYTQGLTATGTLANDTTGKLPTASPTSRSFGTSNYYSTPSTVALNAGSSTMTIQGFMKITTAIPTTGNYYTLVSKTAASPDLGWELRLRKTSSTKYTLDFVGSLNGTTSTTTKPGTATWAVSANTWYNYAITWDKGTVKFYWNGSLKGTGTIGTAGSAALFKSSGPLRLGANTSSGTGTSLWFLGALDELRFSQTVRTISVPTAPYVAD